ncbi:MAG TPA: hypothetical protein VFM20_03655, partial [Nitrososphaeraceae archaeon]|nr:hypothetical protein [Nitrososphaeraceae archaeon]
ADIDVEACPKCHSPLPHYSDYGSLSSATDKSIPHKSPRKAVIIAIVGGIFGLLGLGHMYVGKLGKGFGILSLGIGLIVIPITLAGYLSFYLPDEVGLHPLALPSKSNIDSLFFLFGVIVISFVIGYLLLFIWQVFDARKLAKKFNYSVESTGKEPW